MKPFRQKFFIEAILQAQKISVFFGRILLRIAIEKQLKAPISGGMLQDVIFSRYISEKGLWELLKKFDLIDKKTYKSLKKFNEMRNDFSHNFSYLSTGQNEEIDKFMGLSSQKDMEIMLQEMENNCIILSEKLFDK